ncbi:sigma-54 dependent transcriptional regulator [bacterium]|nr:sigma-54 dependent transcriptional regulator [bacterium]
MPDSKKYLDLKQISVLILDNDASTLRHLKRSLQEIGVVVYPATDTVNAQQIISQNLVHAVLADVNIVAATSFSFLKKYKAVYPAGLFFFMSSKSTIEPVLGLDKSEIDGYFSKPVEIDKFTEELQEKILVKTTSISSLDPLTELLRPYLIFRSSVMRQGLMILPKLAASSHSVLITGDTGTGKEMVARAVHGLSPFANGPFVAVNCGAIPESLIEGELFGHEKGSFTGAQTLHHGKFELARNGTLFLDEIGEMPLLLQARLLRVLEEREFFRIGGEKPIKINLRIVTATQVNVEKSVEDGLFREDLYYRLNVLRIHLPSLRERPEDIPLLAWHFLERAFNELNRKKPYPVLSDEIIKILLIQEWKGNVRELKNLMTRLAVLLPGNVNQITPDHLAAYFPEKRIIGANVDSDPEYEYINSMMGYSNEKNNNVIEVSSIPSEDGVFIPVGLSLRDAEDLIIQTTLKYTGGNRTKAAKILGIGLRTIRRKVNEPSMDN